MQKYQPLGSSLQMTVIKMHVMIIVTAGVTLMILAALMDEKVLYDHFGADIYC
jgi:hypothetical protein